MKHKREGGADLTISYDEADCGTIRVRSWYALKDALKGLPLAKWDPHHKYWTYPAQASALRDILELAGRENLQVDLQATARALLKGWDKSDEETRTRLAKDDSELNYVEKSAKGCTLRQMARSGGGKSSWARAVIKHSEDLDAIRNLLRELGCDWRGAAEGQ